MGGWPQSTSCGIPRMVVDAEVNSKLTAKVIVFHSTEAKEKGHVCVTSTETEVVLLCCIFNRAVNVPQLFRNCNWSQWAVTHLLILSAPGFITCRMIKTYILEYQIRYHRIHL